MRKLYGTIFLLSVYWVAAGCSTTKLTWVSEPQVQKESNETFDVELKPAGIKSGDTQTYKAFVLFLKNKTDRELGVIWDKTFFVYNGQINGGFMFAGVSHEDRDKPKPPDIVPPKGTFLKKIWPNSLVFFYVPEKKAYYEGAWIHRELNPGQNGVSLTVKSGEREINEKIVLEISVQEID